MKLLQRTKYWLQSFPTFIEIIQYTDSDIHRASLNRVDSFRRALKPSRINARIVVQCDIYLSMNFAVSRMKESMNLQKTKHFKKSVRNYYQFWWLLFLPFLKKLPSILNKKRISVISFNLFSQFYLWQPESYSKNRPVLWLVEFLTILTITMIKIAVNNKQTNMIIGTFNPLSSLTDSSVSTVSLDCYWFSRCCLQ